MMADKKKIRLLLLAVLAGMLGISGDCRLSDSL